MASRQLTPPGLPLDDSGFPLALHGMRDEVTRRGGQFVPNGTRWLAYHRDPNVVQVYVYFHRNLSIEVGVSWHEVGYYPHERGLEEFESEFVDILNGGYTEYILLDSENVLRKTGFELQDARYLQPPLVRHDEGLRLVWWRYPAWPEPE